MFEGFQPLVGQRTVELGESEVVLAAASCDLRQPAARLGVRPVQLEPGDEPILRIVRQALAEIQPAERRRVRNDALMD